MKVSDCTRAGLARRRMARDMIAKGYEVIPGPWALVRGGRTREVIVDVVIDASGKSLWVKTAEPSER